MEFASVQKPYQLRNACRCCGSQAGYIDHKSGQDCVYCAGCFRFQYNAPKTETGRATRSVSTTHKAIKPSQRRRILERAHQTCEICHRRGVTLHVGHILSVDDGHKHSLTDDVINSDENLIAECEECNLGGSSRSMPLRLLVALLVARSNCQ